MSSSRPPADASGFRATMCAAVQAELGALLDGELAPALAAELEHHLERCAPCGAALVQVRELRARLRRCAPEQAPPALRERIRRSLRGRGEGGSPGEH